MPKTENMFRSVVHSLASLAEPMTGIPLARRYGAAAKVRPDTAMTAYTWSCSTSFCAAASAPAGVDPASTTSYLIL